MIQHNYLGEYLFWEEGSEKLNCFSKGFSQASIANGPPKEEKGDYNEIQIARFYVTYGTVRELWITTEKKSVVRYLATSISGLEACPRRPCAGAPIRPEAFLLLSTRQAPLGGHYDENPRHQYHEQNLR